MALQIQTLLRKSISLSLALICFSSCSNRTPERPKAQFSNVFGVDDRQIMTSAESLGFLSNGCSGTLVGLDLVLTAAHCILDSQSKSALNPLPTFAPNFKNGRAENVAFIIDWLVGTIDPGSFPNHDWAIFRIDQRLGDHYGYLEFKDVNFGASLPYIVSVAGYSNDFHSGRHPGVHHNCSIRATQDYQQSLIHDCDTTRGFSGGPMLAYFDGRPFIVGVNTAEYRGGGDSSLYLETYDGTRPNFGVWNQDLSRKIAEWNRAQ